MFLGISFMLAEYSFVQTILKAKPMVIRIYQLPVSDNRWQYESRTYFATFM
jgi:hypothetical protein